MTQPGYRGAGDSYGMPYDSGKLPLEGSERISKRKKLAGYLKAANELRQSYQQSASERWGARHADDYDDTEGIPGTFPDVSVVRHGHEELILFPSYCKRHHKRKRSVQLAQSTGSASGEGNDAEWWKQEWDRYEDDKAVVDVDVRGWVYSPHRGPMTRRNRFLVGLARQLSGVPAPKSEAPTSSEGSPPGSLLERHKAAEALRDQERIDREAEDILRKGEDEQEIASRGGYSEDPKHRSYGKGTQSPQRRSGTNTPTDHEPLGSGQLNERSSWNLPADMSPEELAKANTNLMARIMPFMTNPLVSTPITVFFYDDKRSQSKTVTTDESGHFNLRAALDFAPTHVRVLASENLSATEEVKITEPKGVSVISDVDDTIKHSSIGSGAREIFRNAFIRELGDLTIDGVKEWYNAMYNMGVGFHYVSNSPWQLFPVLVTFFQKAGLPPGSYHLKQYSGMLQGIFEPVAERKKGTLERIMNDFPERKFILIGDSGEADLEVYTDVVLAHPGRIIA
jgi:phosphatidate phosphatase APP1